MQNIYAFILLMFIGSASFAQKFYTSSAVITFTSEAPMEKIVSNNKMVTCIVNTPTRDMAFKVIMKSFQFDRQGIYDHFNNDYTESDKFPNATFQGKIINEIDFSKNGTFRVTVEGQLIIHGVVKPIKETGTVEISEGKIMIKSIFNILLSDYGIRVPADFIKRISNTVQLNVNAVLTPYVR